MSRIAYVNGDYVPLEDAKISVLDRGFLFADGVYEVTAVLDGRMLDAENHLVRLRRSMREIGLEFPMSDEEITQIHIELAHRNKLTNGMIYLQITRGAADRDFSFPKGVEPSLVMFTQEKDLRNSPYAAKGVAVVTTPDIRWQRRDIKSVALLAQVLAKQVAAEAGCYEAWMVEDGHVTEGSSSSAFIITKDGAIIARPLNNQILPGITRKSVLALAEEQNLEIEERRFTVDEAYNAAEAFLTSASSLVMPVVKIDDKQVADGRPGPMSLRLRELYIEMADKTEPQI